MFEQKPTMKIRKTFAVIILCLFAALSGCCTCNDFNLKVTEALKSAQEALKSAQHANDIHELNNLMSMHVWYHAALLNDVDVEKNWSKRGDIVFAQNFGHYVGPDSIKAYYGQTYTRESTKGVYMWHPTTSSIIEVAGDRNTAKGVWYTPAGIVGSFKDEPVNFNWMFEKYGVDFVMENGRWKIWHMHIYTDLAWAVGGKIRSSGGGIDFTDISKIRTPDKTEDNYKQLSPATEMVLVPRPPEPYQTWSDTWSYVDTGE
jgi:hypothetical protein